MWVGLAMAATGQTVFFNGVGHSDSDGAVTEGSSSCNVICGVGAVTGEALGDGFAFAEGGGGKPHGGKVVRRARRGQGARGLKAPAATIPASRAPPRR